MKFRRWQQSKHEIESSDDDWGSSDGDCLRLCSTPPPPPPQKRKTEKFQL
jgi:hypothetical protein